ncbi:P2X purinoceptor 4-like [Paramacrobiotus metropolitanus]|uniref:P2X purinoceptor 4-like n=1 Tax=Paramacrobiotus metropolitanus TaxID=2943436 RepID=UPI0024461C46|nr:P2X purinoceptor 4-like [Paramacrobiotus metropolitanus]
MAHQEKCTSVLLRSIQDTFTKYETARSVRFHSPVVALCNRLIQGTVIAYIIIVVFLFDKGYQLQEQGESSVVAKVVGLQRNLKKDFHDNTSTFEALALTWDSSDTVVPPLENDAVFITTKLTATPKQVQTVCPEDKDVGANCQTNADCRIGRSIHLGHGHLAGTCNGSTGTCDVHAWCPLENENRRSVELTGGRDLVVLVKNYILFPKYRIRRRNIGELDDDYVKSCAFNVKTDPYCPAFNLGYIIEQAGEDYNEMADIGAVLSFAIRWDCNLDYHIRHCVPKYSFRRLDEKKGGSFPGWNYRRTGYWEENGRQIRYLLKHTGIRIVFNVYAVAGKFSFVRFTMNLGSGLGLLGTATILCDFLIYQCARRNTKDFRTQAATLIAENELRDAKLNGEVY